jgi:cytochrome c peroxidase
MAKSRRVQVYSAVGVAATVALVFGAMKVTQGAVEYGVQPTLPLGVSPVLYEISVPHGQPPTPAQVALGSALFNDKRLSVDNSVACATCHDPKKGFTDHRAGNATSAGVQGKRGSRNSPTVLNAMFQATQFWDGRSADLEAQAKLPILNPVEMGQKSPDDVVAKLRGIPEYVTAFRSVYGADITYDNMAAAIGAFERTIASSPATPARSASRPSAAGRCSTARRAAPIATPSMRILRCFRIRSSTTSASPPTTATSPPSRAKR